MPEKSSSPVTELFACRYIQVLVSGRYSEDGSVLVEICNRIQRKKTGHSDFDDNERLYGVPLDGQWHWQTDMKEILAWCELPAADDTKWIPCSTALPEETEEIYSSGRLKMVSVLALHELYSGIPTVSLLNRIYVEKSGIEYLDEQATNGWEWSKNAGTVKAWMPFPEAALKNVRKGNRNEIHDFVERKKNNNGKYFLNRILKNF